MKHYCVRDNKRYRETQVGSQHCKDCPIIDCRVIFDNQHPLRKLTRVT